LCELFQKLDLAWCLNRDSLHLWNLADRRFRTVPLSDQIDRQHRPRSAEARFAVNRHRALRCPLLVDKTDKFGRLFRRRCATVGHWKTLKKTLKCKTGRFKHRCVGWNIQPLQTSDAGSSANHHRRAAQDDLAAMHSRVTHAGGRFAANHHGRGTHGNRVRWTHTNTHVADHGGGHASDQDCWITRAGNRAADMWNGRHARRHHRADVHIG